MPDDRLLDALTNATAAKFDVSARIGSLEGRVVGLEGTLEKRMGSLESEVTTMNAYLDNLVREVQQTNHLLREDQEYRREVDKAKAEAERAELEHQRKLELEKRATVRGVVSEIWSTVKQPWVLFAGAFALWFIHTYLGVSPEAVRAQVQTIAPAPSGEEP